MSLAGLVAQQHSLCRLHRSRHRTCPDKQDERGAVVAGESGARICPAGTEIVTCYATDSLVLILGAILAAVAHA